MSEVSDSADAANSTIRWPHVGDRPFVEAADPRLNAEVVEPMATRTWLMIRGFKTAADLMVEQSARSQMDRDSLVFPILFNYRHFIELSLKELVEDFGAQAGVSPNWNSHNLTTLWGLFRKTLEAWMGTQGKATDDVVEDIVNQFALIDPGSFSFRYPRDTSGRPVPVSRAKLDLQALKDVVDGAASYFSSTGDYFADLKRHMAD